MSFLGCTLIAGILPLQLSPLDHQTTLHDGLDNPARLWITTTELFVADTRANAVLRFDLSGNLLNRWNEPAGPVGVTAHPDGRILVSRRDDARVGIYDSNFGLLGFLAEGLVTFAEPTDLAVDPGSGRIYVVDSGADRFYAFSSSGSLEFMVGNRGTGYQQFKCPSAIALDAVNQRIIVADQDNFRVQVFSGNGLFLFSFGYRIKFLSTGGSEGWFPRPAGLAVDGMGRIYVTDALMSTLRVFTSQGAELGKVVEFGSASGQLQTPADVALDAFGRAYVANSNVGEVEVYSPLSSAVASESGIFWEGTNDCPYDRWENSYTLTRSSRLPAMRSKLAADPLQTAAVPPGWEPPHMLDDTTCGRCHSVNGQPGIHLGTVDGQTYLCLSCHTGGGHAPTTSLRTTDRVSFGSPPPESGGRSHAWGVSAVNAASGSVGPPAGSEMARYLSSGLMKCATCHNQHNNEAGRPYLRVNNISGGLCLTCHVGYVGHTPSGSWQPTCSECHDMHEPKSGNISLIATQIRNRTLGVDKPVILTSKTGPHSFDDGDPSANDGLCQVCHTSTNYHRHDGSGDPHNDGAACTMCHPHQAGFMPTGGACDSCHGAPPPSGAHLAHFGGDVSEAAYGATGNLSTESNYVFQCGNCHPLSPGFHRNGVVNVELCNAAAPAGSLKSLSPLTAAYTPGGTVFRDANGLPYTLGTCSNVYCHSATTWSSPSPISAPLVDPTHGWPLLDANGNLTYEPFTVTTGKSYATVNWGDSALGCNGCHRNNPQTTFPTVQAGVGNSHGWIDDWEYEDLHAWNMGYDPLTCRVCHYNTVTAPMTWTRDAMGITYFDDVEIADRAHHVNGVKDVAFDAVNPVIYPTSSRLFSFSLAGMSYDPRSRVCSNAPCHLNQTSPEWGKPYRWWLGSLECDQCHRYGGPWPTAGESASANKERVPWGVRATVAHSKFPRQACPECHVGHRMAH